MSNCYLIDVKQKESKSVINVILMWLQQILKYKEFKVEHYMDFVMTS